MYYVFQINKLVGGGRELLKYEKSSKKREIMQIYNKFQNSPEVLNDVDNSIFHSIVEIDGRLPYKDIKSEMERKQRQGLKTTEDMELLYYILLHGTILTPEI